MSPHPATEAYSTPDKSLSEDRKRKRDVLSCLDCRRRKLKCDRVFPVCGRCQRGRNAASCTYKSPLSGDERPVVIDQSGGLESRQEKRPRTSYYEHQPNGMAMIPNGNLASPSDMLSQPNSALLAQEKTIKMLEARLADLERFIDHSSVARDTMEEASSKSVETRGAEAYIFKGKAFKTQFYGNTLPMNQLAHFPELRAFMKEVHPNSTMQRLQNENRAFDNRSKERRAKTPESIAPDLMSLVPDRARVERLVQSYFENIESTYRILHKGIFWKEYDAFWRTPQDATPGFLPILLLIMALARCMLPEETMSFNSNGSSARNEAISWIRASDSWLEQQSQKHRFMEIYQVMCLRVLAARANAFKSKRAYQNAEGLLAYFRCAGFHRDPNLLEEKRCSPFQKEMRRRLWATVTEIELQASIERGFPSTLSAVPSDCKPPLNIDDEDLLVDLSQFPTSNASAQYTATSFLRLSCSSLPLRVALCSLVNDPNVRVKYDDVLNYEQQIREALSAIPTWTEAGGQQASTLLELQLSQFLIILHSPFARQNGFSHQRYSRMVSFEASKRILDLHFQCITSGRFAFAFLRQDVFRAATSICHNAYLCTLETSDIFFSGIMVNFSSMVNTALKILEENGLRIGDGLHDYWFVSAARSLVEMRLSPERAATFKLQATERVATLYKRILDSSEKETIPQKPPGLLPGTSLPPLGPDTTSWFYTSSVLGFTDQPDHLALSSFDHFDTSEWTLDDVWPMDEDYSTFN